jgi:hypothetical protein
MPPSVADIVVGCAAVILACAGGAYAARAAGRGRNRLWLICGAGCLALVVGVVGQRTFPSEDAVGKLGKDAAARQVPGPWDAGVGIPVIGLHVTPVALAGLLLSIAGVSLVLFFEPVAGGDPMERRPLAVLEEDDAV